MQLYLLRHGQSEANDRNLVCGASDFALSEKGKGQARQACQYLGQKSFTRIYASPLSRAVETIASLERQIPLRLEPDLVELNTGTVSNMTLPELWALDARFKKPWLSPDLRYPGGECFSEMVGRISHWFKTEKASWEDLDSILIVGHEGTLRVIYLNLLALALKDYPDFPIGNCDYLYFRVEHGQLIHYEHVKLPSMTGASDEASSSDNIS